MTMPVSLLDNISRIIQSVLKTSTSFLVALGWFMMGAMKLVVIRQIFNKQLAEAAHGWEADNISRLLYQIWIGNPLNGVNDVVNYTLSLIVRNVSSVIKWHKTLMAMDCCPKALGDWLLYTANHQLTIIVGR